MSVLVYRKDKIYDPNTECNKLRRNMKKTIRMNYIRRPLSIPALNVMLRIPGIKQMYQLTMLIGIKVMQLIANDDQKEFLNLKTDMISNDEQKDIKTNRVAN